MFFFESVMTFDIASLRGHSSLRGGGGLLQCTMYGPSVGTKQSARCRQVPIVERWSLEERFNCSVFEIQLIVKHEKQVLTLNHCFRPIQSPIFAP